MLMKTIQSVMLAAAFCLLVPSCGDRKPDRDYRKDMRDFVENISIYSRSFQDGFILITQNGVEIISLNGEPDGPLAESYLSRITGVAQEDLFFGYQNDDVLTPLPERNYLIAYLDRLKSYTEPKIVLTVDYCSSPANMDSSYEWNFRNNYVSFAAPSRELDLIPAYPEQPFRVNPNSVKSITTAKNFLYLINPDRFATKKSYISALDTVRYDVLIIDLFYKDTVLTTDDIDIIRYKPPNMLPRKVLCYMSIGEAEDYRYYWNPAWRTDPPSWLEDENPEWPGNYKVRYWDKEWQNIIYGNNQSYVKKIIDAGFDGVYLDIIEAFEYFE